MILRQVANAHAIATHIGMYPIPAKTVDDAIARLKAKWPGVVPHTCLWHAETPEVNRYYFLFEPGSQDPAKQVRER